MEGSRQKNEYGVAGAGALGADIMGKLEIPQVIVEEVPAEDLPDVAGVAAEGEIVVPLAEVLQAGPLINVQLDVREIGEKIYVSFKIIAGGKVAYIPFYSEPASPTQHNIPIRSPGLH